MTFKSTLIGCLAAAAASLALPAAGHAELMFVTGLDDGNGPPITGNQSWGGQLGDDFVANDAISITRIGIFDSNADGTTTDLVWQLFNVGDGSLVYQQTIGATANSGGLSLADNYVWADLVTPLDLLAGNTYSAVAYGFNSTNENFNTNNSGALSVDFNVTGITAGGGRYSSATGTSFPTTGTGGNVLSTAPYNFGVATFTYVTDVPEPATLGLLGIGLLGIGALSRRRRT